MKPQVAADRLRDLRSVTDAALAYLPLEDLLNLLALESHRHRAVVIGEDLGTVPPGFRSRLRRAGIAGMDVLWFERTRLNFKKPSRWRADAVGMTTTHDLPTVAGWWSGEDIRTRRALGLGAPGEDEERKKDSARLWRAFTNAGVAGPLPPPDQPAPAVDAALGYVAQAPSPLMLAPVEDLLGLVDQPNLAGALTQCGAAPVTRAVTVGGSTLDTTLAVRSTLTTIVGGTVAYERK